MKLLGEKKTKKIQPARKWKSSTHHNWVWNWDGGENNNNNKWSERENESVTTKAKEGFVFWVKQIQTAK